MSRTFQDRNFVVWEVYPSSGRFGAAAHPHLVFNCLTNTHERPRWLPASEHEANAERQVEQASNDELIALLEQSRAME